MHQARKRQKIYIYKCLYLALGNKQNWDFQFNSIQFNLFSIKQQTHLKNTQDGGDATKSKSLKDVAPPLQLKTTTTKQT